MTLTGRAYRYQWRQILPPQCLQFWRVRARAPFYCQHKLKCPPACGCGARVAKRKACNYASRAAEPQVTANGGASAVLIGGRLCLHASLPAAHQWYTIALCGTFFIPRSPFHSQQSLRISEATTQSRSGENQRGEQGQKPIHLTLAQAINGKTGMCQVALRTCSTKLTSPRAPRHLPMPDTTPWRRVAPLILASTTSSDALQNGEGEII